MIGSMRVAFLGFGLIGGSIARALRGSGRAWSLTAWSPSGFGPQSAAADGVLDDAAGSAGDAIAGADVLVLAAPPLACLDLLGGLASRRLGELGRATIVTDVASTKVALCRRAAELGVRFVGGHPMAGRELTGYAAGDAELLRERPWIIVPDGATEDDVVVIEQLASATGARPARMGAEAHDVATAAVSHLPLVVATALVEAVAGDGAGGAGARGAGAIWTDVAQLAASGWRDTTRLARGDPAMGAGIAATNAAPLAARVRAIRERLDEWLDELERPGGPDAARIEARFAAARDVLEGRQQ
jgi:prephenate dehydrogenase